MICPRNSLIFNQAHSPEITVEIPFWHDRWKQNEIGFHQAEVNRHLQEFWPQLGLQPHQGVFVPLCGKSRDLLWLRAQGHPALGVEISPIAVRDFFKENNLDPRVSQQGPFECWEADGLTILCGDFFSLIQDTLRGMGTVFDRASLIALPPDMRPRYAEHLKAIIPANAVILLVTLDYPQADMAGPPFSVEEAEVRRLYEPHYRVARLRRQDIMTESPQFRKRGLNTLHEHVYRLDPVN